MRETEYMEVVSDLFNARTLMQSHRHKGNLLELIEDRILLLNAHIDAMPALRDEYQQRIVMTAYEFYRLKEQYLDEYA